MFDRVIVWGFPLHTHTHSYIHGSWVKAFKYLGYETFWFHDENYPKDFDYSNSLFITEGYADKNIPILKTSIYFVHICINPDKYLGKVKRLIEIRYLVDHIKDCNYNYVLDKSICKKISEATYYQKLQDNGDLMKFSNNPVNMNYECIYTCWATDLLPHEIREESIIENKNNRENVIYWMGSYNSSNNSELRKFIETANKYEIKTIFNNPWQNPLSYDDIIKYTKLSYMSPDIRCSGDPNKIRLGETGTCHKKIGYIPCRVFKAISYGMLGITNSRHVYELLDKKVIYSDDESELFDIAQKNIDNRELIKEQMKIVRDKHTYVNRINDLLEVLKFE